MDDFIRRGLGLDPTLVGWALEGLKVMNPEKALRACHRGGSGQGGGDHAGGGAGGKERRGASEDRHQERRRAIR